MKSTQLILLLALAVASCGGGAGKTTSVDAADQQSADAAAEVESPEDVVLPTDLAPEDAGLDLSPDLGTDTGPTPQCAPGEGCFLDQCEENAECLSGWCVEHIGEGVCTDVCQEECPPGWSCKLLGGGGPDPTYACVSNMSNLCKPCATNADCKSPGAQEDVCVDYGEEGSFCGGACLSDEECPWGFSCGEAVTVSGIGTLQCVAETGICPCSGKSAKLGLSTPCVNASESGTCTGQRVCTDAGLTECDAAAPSIEECNGVDDDCDGDVDEPTAQGGNLINLCDDGNECTQDICGGEAGCSYTELDSGECKDGDACTVGDHCEAGECVGQLVDCDDGNPCTEDWCNPAGGCAHGNSDEECDDGNACTVADRCSDGLCSGYALNCDCEADADCAAFEDDNLCNGTLLCSKEALPYQCEVDPGTVVECEPLTGEAAKCNAAKCDPASGSCIAVPVADGTLCDDGNPCTVTESCVAGECQGGQAVNCNDGNPCTVDACDPATGCTHGNSSEKCEDGNLCTAGDVCDGGICKAGEAVNCDDGNPCTTDTCDPATGCAHGNSNEECSDGNACTTGDHCVDGACVYDAVLTCDDGNVCTTDSCNPASGCAYKLNAAPCDDGNLCTTGDHCHLGECISGGTLNCNDGNVCTVDSCEPAAGCVFTNSNDACDDGSQCTVGDTCSNGWCLPGPALDCDDGNPCTTDTCNPATGCTHGNSNEGCEDGDLCTVGDQCVNGQCVAGGPADCDDANTCTTDSCNPATGCVHTSTGQEECDDGNACTEGDLCAQGVCVPGAPVTCNDGNPCTDDSCNPQSGCLFAPNSAACDDGSACTVGDHCSGGQCLPGDAVNCNDENPCTTDSCNPQTGCDHASVADGTECGQDLICMDGECTSCGQLHGSQTYSYTGGKQTFVVPQCIAAVTVTAYGAEAGNGHKGASGKGGSVVATITVTPGEALSVYVGGKGAPGSGSTGGNGGWNGGGNGTGYGNTCYTGGGGGGASDVRRGGDSLDHRVVVAGGGGGGGGDPSTCNASWGGAGGGLVGQDAQPSVQAGIDSNGKGGTQSAGGAGGDWNNGNDGGWGFGGQAGMAGGGGGGGLYGGGGGGHGGGGGGSSYAHPSAANVSHQQGGHAGHGQVVISW